MATKLTKSAGKILGQSSEYWINAAKQFVWPIDFSELQILVPESDLNLAEQDLMVSHFRVNGWHIQSSIDVKYTSPYIAPIGNGKPMFAGKPKEEASVKKSLCSVGDKFMVKSSDCKLEVTHVESGKVHFKYTNRNKAPLLSSEENLKTVLNRGQWIKIN